ncbi:MAG: ribonuclease HII [Candidatus Woesearchaeota archaeon]
MKHLIGIDEAGRGPVIGPMILAGTLICENNLDSVIKEFQIIGVKDSKKLTRKKREEVYEKLVELKKKNLIDFDFIIIQPSEIDEFVEGSGLNLNRLEIIKMIEIIHTLLKKYNGTFEIYIDCPSTNIKSYISDFFSFLRKNHEIIYQSKNEVKVKSLDLDMYFIFSHKADQKYPIVSASSIIAKVTRDRIIEEIKKKIDYDFGSGYSSDPKTMKFVKENFDKYDIFRKSWETWKRQKEKKIIDFLKENDA